MGSDELRFLVGVPETIAVALHQLRCPKRPFTRVRPLRHRGLAGVALEFSSKKKRIDNFPGAALWLFQKKVV